MHPTKPEPERPCETGAQRQRNQNGLALVFVLLLLVALTLPAIMLVSASSNSMRAQTGTRAQVECLNAANLACEEGAARLIPDLNAYFQSGSFYPESAQALTSGTVNAGAHDLSYEVTATGGDTTSLSDLTEQRVELAATCRGPQNTSYSLAIGARALTGSVFSCALCACRDIALANNFSSDSYDSQLLSYGSSSGSTWTANGDLCADRDVSADDSVVDGDIIAGNDITGTGTVAGTTIAGGVNDLGGATGVSPAPYPCNCEYFDLDGVVANAAVFNDNLSAGDCQPYLVATDLSISGSDSCTLPAGSYYLSNLQITGSASIAIGGPVKLYLDLNIGNFRIDGNGFVNDPANASDLQIYSRSSERIDYKTTQSLSGYLYAPNAELRIDADTEVFGALTAYDIDVRRSLAVHYDEEAGEQRHFIADLERGTWRGGG